MRKFTVLNDIDKILRANKWYQGDLYEKSKIVRQAHDLLASLIKKNDIIIDATLGNGYDSLLSQN